MVKGKERKLRSSLPRGDALWARPRGHDSAMRTLDHVIVRIAVFKCYFWNAWFVFRIVFFSRVSQVFFFLYPPVFSSVSSWSHRLLLVCLQDHVRSSIPIPYKYIMFCCASFAFVLNMMLLKSSYLRLHRTTSPNIVFFSHRHDNSNPAVNSVFI